MPRPLRSFPAALFQLVLVLIPAARAAAGEATIDFDRQVRPILSENCFKCHGPDEEQRKKVKTKLRLDTKDGLSEQLDDIRPVVPGDLAKSEVYRRITITGDDQMPPADSGKKLTAQQVAIIKRWIEQGAPWKQHWAFVPPQRPAPPTVTDAAWPLNDIDRFVLARQEKNALHHAPEASRSTLLRRVSLDLIGLPPTPADVDAFQADRSATAYEKVVDRLLASPQYGERMAMSWLDGARYADSNGFQSDTERSMWRWRDWVIDAFNRNMPFDEFTIEQLAGDLLPNPTAEQRIATGFNRNHRINTEGGIIPEEWAVETCIDRVDTTGQVWLGLTLGCARCHDHKYDPISQRDFYRLFAFYNNVPESGMGSEALSGTSPTMKAPTDQQTKRLAELDASLAALKKDLAALPPATESVWSVLAVHAATTAGGTVLTQQADGSLLASKAADHEVYTIKAVSALRHVGALRLEVMPDPSLPAGGPGAAENGNFVLSKIALAVVTASGSTPVPLLSAEADFSQDGYPIGNTITGKPDAGWAVSPKFNAAHQAIFSFAGTDLPADAALEVTMTSASGYARHIIGHFRLAAAVGIDAARAKVQGEIASTEKERSDLDAAITTVMVMEELPQPRPSFILTRGQYNKHEAEVTAGTPAAFAPLPAGAPNNRLGLARWITDPANPLTARVAVNRMWERLFGVGLVKTSENFGSQGDQPSHPELLDWLASEFVRTKWDMKAMIKTMVMSATYRQASTIDAQTAASDPENRMLTHGPRFRLQAEEIRDQALAIAGLLVNRIGGPTVRPYQPEGIWDELSSYGNLHNYHHDQGDNLYRRSLYTIWKRTTPPPDMNLFDMPSREYCIIRRSRTDTPLQALALLNDETFVEAGRVLAGLMIKDGGATPASRITYGFRRVTARAPTSAELAILSAGLQRRLARFRADPDAAKRLIAIGDSASDPHQDPAELAAYATTATTLLNLDETITKE